MMARTVEKLTALAVSKAKSPGYFGDGAGLYLQVSKTGTKSWIFRYTRERKQREMGLGAVHTVTLAEARGKARDCRALLLEGKDPLDTRAADKLTDALTALGQSRSTNALAPTSPRIAAAGRMPSTRSSGKTRSRLTPRHLLETCPWLPSTPAWW